MYVEFETSKDKKALEFPHFPTRFQAVVWRNWGLVSPDRIAKVIGASSEQVIELAEEMGLADSPDIDPIWLQRGFITIIRFNWHLLPYEQLLVLLGWTEEQLEFALKEDDFLWIKLGSLKPLSEPVKYRPLTSNEQRRTRELKEHLHAHFPLKDRSRGSAERPFSFMNQFAFSDDTFEWTESEVANSSYSAASDEDVIVIDQRWTVVYPHGTKWVMKFAERFAKRHLERWGIPLTTGEAHTFGGQGWQALAEEQCIRLELAPNAELLAESHEVHIGPDGIDIKAVDEVGLLRGLQYIARQMLRAKGPILQAGSSKRTTKVDLRYVYSYFAVFGDPFIDPDLNPYPDDLLERLSELGVNGVWLQSVMYNLVQWEEAPELSHGCDIRMGGLRKLVDRAADYGIRIYLYYNEPRTMPLPFFERHPEWRGHVVGEYATLCTSHPDIQQYLREGTARLFRDVPGLGGIFMITMSENLTNCYSGSQGKTNCQRCSDREAHEVIAEVVRVVTEGAHSVSPEARIICWTWGWAPGYGWSEDDVMNGIKLLPDGISVMCTSEHQMATNVAEIPGIIVDYSISNVGPSELSRNTWKVAHERGLKAMAKVQFNNTWECAAVPFLPVFDLVQKHIEGLMESGVSGLQLSWTLGGYPSPNLELVSEYYWENDGQPESRIRTLLHGKFGTQAGDAIADASTAFSRAFTEFPFECGVVYIAPQNYGPSNLLYLQPTGYKSTMIGFPYDDLQRWRSIYPSDKFATQFKKLSLGWKKGLELIAKAERYITPGQRSEFNLLQHAAQGAFHHFYSTYLQITFVILRDRLAKARSQHVKKELREKLLTIVDREIDTAKALYEIMRLDSRIGYEATNHYFYTTGSLQEKVLNCLNVRALLVAGGELP
ncbi:hypothetical protein [Paenibacillus eucommiae]|uniref:Beta-hexosaminidase bacterial type N-terminal domain-containing protein n=1 Tax=Paenibacillus eucommiae TaxID=1355755 RepID=A0ABS4J8X9_9BACL|nr:hypothetical protein [Paenibacillus eucommiae]MBP1996303.1 hypothetical protein [Paenibacillus eucommiae]